MASSARPQPVFRFDSFELDTCNLEVRKAGIPLKLHPQPYRVLLMLVEHRGEVVTREQIRQALWGHNTFVDFERGINFSINQIRTALSDDAANPRYIETIPRRGYRFIAAVKASEARPVCVSIAPVQSSAPGEFTSETEAARAAARTTEGSALLAAFERHRWIFAGAFIVIGLALAAVVYSTHRLSSRASSADRSTHRQFTFLGDAYWPAISPDGLFVAYVTQKLDEPQKLMVQASNGTSIELARGTEIRSPRWSPDGAEVLFLKREPAFSRTEHSENYFGIFVVSRLGGVARPIAKAVYACWLTSDGAEIVTAAVAEATDFKGVRILNKITGETREVHLSDYAFLHDVDCSPQTSGILAVTRGHEKFQIWIFKQDGSEQRKLIEESDQIYSARWSPAGDSIYYLHGKGDTNEISKVSVSGEHHEPVTIVNGLQTGEFFTLSADASRLAYTREDAYSNLWRIKWPNVTESKPEYSRLTSGTFHYSAPSFSPDGRSLAFVLGPNVEETNIFKMQVGDSEAVQLTFFEHARTASPAWSPDGQRIGFISDINGTAKVWTVPTTGGRPQVLENTDASDSNYKLAWWPSDDIIYQGKGNRNFLRVDQKKLTETPVVQHDKPVGWVPAKPIFSPDGKKMAVLWNRHGLGLWIISLEPYSENFVHAGLIYPFGWSPDGKYVYAIGGREIMRTAISTPIDLRLVWTLPDVNEDVTDDDCATLSPDGRQIIITVQEEKSDVWLIENFDPSADRAKSRSN